MPKATGRPSSYKPEFAKLAVGMCKLGATDIEIADTIGIDIRTLYKWKAAHADFGHALKTGKADADTRVERSLYERACGYERDEVDIRVVNGVIVQTPIRKFYPPDVVACIFWLKNRRPDIWRDKREEAPNLTPEEAAREAQEAVQRARATSAAPS